MEIRMVVFRISYDLPIVLQNRLKLGHFRKFQKCVAFVAKKRNTCCVLAKKKYLSVSRKSIYHLFTQLEPHRGLEPPRDFPKFFFHKFWWQKIWCFFSARSAEIFFRYTGIRIPRVALEKNSRFYVLFTVTKKNFKKKMN